MFGSDKNNVDTTQMSASDSTGMPPLSTAIPNGSGPAATNDAPAPSAPADPLQSITAAASAPLSSGSGISDVNLENAYIPADPPQIIKNSSKDSSDSTQPTAASLLDDSNHDDLLKLKQQALQNLAPLVGHLDQTPEEKFKTTMMLIQASDNADLIPEAYEAAGKIEDEKVRAQALLDVVNEINYFTHQANQEEKAA